MRSDSGAERLRESGVRRGGALFLCLLLLVSCGKLLGLQSGTTQAACTTDAQCAPGYGCLQQLGCRNRCTADSDCGAGSRCFKAFVTTACIPVTEGCGSANPDSGASDGCPEGTHCDGSVCRTQCDTTDQCAGGQDCVSGACVSSDPSHEGASGGASGGSGGAASGGSGGMSGGGGTGGAENAGAGGAGTGGAPADLCLGKVCDTPPASDCDSGSEFKSYDKAGSCAAGVCSYTSHAIACTCQNHACPTDPCAGVTCASPPATTCKDVSTVTTYASSGTCSGGTCSYAPTNTACGSNKLCSGAGVCSECKVDTGCGASCGACGGGTPKCKDLGTTSQCVGCLSNADCSGAMLICNPATNTCAAQPSCAALAATCGPNGNSDCCSSSVVTGGTFNRGNDANYQATVSDFRLDNYEITVGRFRKFWTYYPGNMPVGGRGKNPNNGTDPGWDASWQASLPVSHSALTTNIQCDVTYQTWTAGNDSLPMNCIDWFEAEAFCIWDGGRLPTEAEWNYAAAGGTQQWVYPWGSTPPAADAKLAVYGCYYGGSGSCTSVANIAAVGSIAAGNGYYGQADLAGNVWEWVQDWYASPYTSPCNNCADVTVSPHRVFRGGGFYNSASYLLSSNRSSDIPSNHNSYIGARCARTR